MWFDGPVAEAVSLVNTKNCVFVVYIYDDSADSQRLDATLDNPIVVQKVTSEAVALKMQKDSDNAKLFQQLYPTPHVPILYFIRQGTIKDFGKEDTTAEEIVAKIDKASVSSPAQPVSSPAQPVSSAAQSSQTPPPVSSPTQPSSSSSSTPANDTSSDLSRKEKLRKQMEEARKKREEKEKQDARDRETKRRQDGKMMQQTREQMEDQRNKQHFAKIKKEKKEDEEHRRKIKEQIARDRAEQIAARQAAKQRKSDTSSTSPRPSSNTSSQHNTSSISIRQLDGSTIRNKFQASDTLGAVKDWIDQNRTDGDQPYKLLAQFPTRQFSIGEEQHSLRDLGLCPSATIIMKAIKNVSNAYGASNGYGMMDYVYSAGGMLYNAASTVGSTMSGVVYSLFPSEQAVSSGSSPTVGGYPSSSTFNGGQRLGGDASSSSSRPTSNVNTLRTSEFDDNDDDRRTYNGNSLNQE